MIPLLVDLDREWRGGQNQFLLLLKGLYERGHAAELLTAKGLFARASRFQAREFASITLPAASCASRLLEKFVSS